MADTQQTDECGSEDKGTMNFREVNATISVEGVSVFLCQNGIPHGFCEVFEGKVTLYSCLLGLYPLYGSLYLVRVYSCQLQI